MTMRNQIETGVYSAIQHSAPGSALSTLTDAEADHLVAQVLASLSVVPADTPESTLAVVPAATPVLTISPAALVAMIADEAYVEVNSDSSLRDAFTIIEETWAAGEDHREYREFLFAIQPMFGVRVRSVTNESAAFFLVAGTRIQIRAFQRTAMLINNLAQPVLADLSTSQRKEFWATLGHLVASAETAQTLIDDNTEAYAEATEWLNAEHGRARTLPRHEAAVEGPVFDRATAVMTASEGL